MYIAAIWRVVRGANEASFAREGVRHLRRAACASLAHGALDDTFAADHHGILPAFPFFGARMRAQKVAKIGLQTKCSKSWVYVTARCGPPIRAPGVPTAQTDGTIPID